MIRILIPAEDVPKLLRELQSSADQREPDAGSSRSKWLQERDEARLQQLSQQIISAGMTLDTLQAKAALIRPGVEAQAVIDALVPDVQELLAVVNDDDAWSDGPRQALRIIARRIGDRLGEDGPA
jgi:hypothetical protein